MDEQEASEAGHYGVHVLVVTGRLQSVLLVCLPICCFCVMLYVTPCVNPWLVLAVWL